VPEDASGELALFSRLLGQGDGEKSPGLVLSGAERTREALLAAGIAVEHTRIVGPVDSRRTALMRRRWPITVVGLLVVTRGCICGCLRRMWFGCAACLLGGGELR
jgi:hypothetical protein